MATTTSEWSVRTCGSTALSTSGLAREPDVSLQRLRGAAAIRPARGTCWPARTSITSPPRRTNCRTQWFARAELLARCPNLLCVSAGGAGYDTVDVAACTAAGVAVVNQAGGNAASVAEHTLGLMLGVSRRMVEGDRRMRREIGYAREDVMGHEIRGKTVGLVGIGHIGTRVAALARAFGMEVIATDPFLSARGDRAARREGGVVRRTARAVGLRVAALPARCEHAEDDERRRLRPHEEGRDLHHDGARRHPRRSGAGAGPAVRPPGRAPAWTCGTRSLLRSTTRCWRWTTSSPPFTWPA